MFGRNITLQLKNTAKIFVEVSKSAFLHVYGPLQNLSVKIFLCMLQKMVTVNCLTKGKQVYYVLDILYSTVQ